MTSQPRFVAYLNSPSTSRCIITDIVKVTLPLSTERIRLLLVFTKLLKRL
jgi:hypothetical protein